MRFYYIKKNGLFLKIETITYESDYWEVSEIVAESRTRYSWTDDKDEAKTFPSYSDAMTYLAKRSKQLFFKGAEIK